MSWLSDKLKETWATVNMFDGGKTAATVRATRNSPPPATIPQQPVYDNVQDKIKNAKFGVLANNKQGQDQFLRDTMATQRNILNDAKISASESNFNPIKIGKAVGKSFWETGDAIKQYPGALRGNQNGFKESLDQSIVGGIGRSGQSLASTILSPYSNYLADRERQRAERLLTPAYENLYKAHGYNPAIGKNQAELEAGAVDYSLRTDPLIRSNIGVNDTPEMLRRKILAQTAEGVVDAATLPVLSGATKTAAKTAVKESAKESGKFFTKEFVKDTAKSGAISGLGNVLYAAQQDNPTSMDYAKQFAMGATIGTALPLATRLVGQSPTVRQAGQTTSRLVDQNIITPAKNVNRNLGLIRPVNLTPTEVADIHLSQSKRLGLGDVTPEQYDKGVRALQKAGINPADPVAIDNMLDAYRHFETRRANTVEKVKEVKQKIDDKASLGLAMKPVDAEGNPIKNFEPRPFSERGGKREIPDFADPGVKLPKYKQPTEFAKQDYTPPEVINKKPTRTEFADENKMNTGRLNLDKESRDILDQETIQVIGNMSHKDIENIAKSAGLDTKTYGIDGTKKKIAEQLNQRKSVVRLMNERRAAIKAGDKGLAEKLTAQAAEAGRISDSQGADIARQLSARRIIANELDTPEQRIFKLLDKAGVNPEVYAKKLADLDFDDPKAVVAAYRDLVPGKASNWLDTLRYNSMLSSPLTQSVNVFGNAQGVSIIAPVEKTLRGAIDAAGGLFGKERQYAATEGIAYFGGTVKNIRQASNNFVDALRGVGKYANTDLEEFNMPLATKGIKGATYNTLSAPMKVLDGFDKFFRTLAEGGEESALKARERAGIKIKGNRTAIKEAEANYRVFQTPLGEPGQGIINNAFDEFANLAMRGRSSKNPIVSTTSKFTIPFVKTINNIAKQGIVDYSPLGFINLKGNADKTTAITRAIMGTAVFGTSAALLESGQMTWAEPRDPEERARFRAEGRQPYAVKVGNKWVNFSKLNPAVAFPMAMTAALDDAVKSGKTDQSTVDGVLEAFSKFGNFLSDQSYAKSVGDTLAAVGGDKEAIASAVSNNIQQVVPFRALTGWIARVSDDVERKVDTSKGYFDQQVQSLMQQYPGLRQKTQTRDYRGEPIAANKPLFNGISPVRVTEDRGVNPLDQEADRLASANEKDPLLNKQQVKEVDKRVESTLSAMQRQIINTPEYQKLSDKDKAARLDKVKADLKAVERKKYMSENQVGEFAQNFDGKSTKLTADQLALANGKFNPSRYVSGTDETKDYATQLEDALTKFEADKSSLSPVQTIKRQKEIAQLKVKKDFDEDTVSLYGMSKEEAYDYLSNSKDGKALANKMLAYGDALVKAGLADQNKFRDKYGKETIKPKDKNTGSSRINDVSLYSGSGATALSLRRNLQKLLDDAKIGGKKA